ncbi:MAG: hypothetical protein QXP91_03000 [Candidatus Methanomethylicia archaeon]
MPKKARIIRDGAGWLKEGVEQLGLEQENQKHGERNLVERLFAYLKHRTSIFFHNINVNLRNTIRKLRESEQSLALNHLNSFLRAFKFYYDFLGKESKR